jgi:serine/threonine protein phosphatase PrpC
MALEAFVRSIAKVAGEDCGDAFWYHEDGPILWVSVIDGLGSGPEAAVASRRAVETLSMLITGPDAATLPSDPAQMLGYLVKRCDAALRSTRGAAMAIARFDRDQGQGAFCGVGNVEMRIIGEQTQRTICAAGIVGTGNVRTQPQSFPYRPGDIIIMHSDGISTRYDAGSLHHRRHSLEVLGEHLMAEHAKDNDDITLVLLRQR